MFNLPSEISSLDILRSSKQKKKLLKIHNDKFK